MANPDQLQILRQGVKAWNAWRKQHGDVRPDLSAASLIATPLSGVDLSRTDLSGTDLSVTDLSRADLSRADLIGTDLRQARLTEANLTNADLHNADLTGALLIDTNLSRAFLMGADLSEALLYGTIFGDSSLSVVRGLETCRHEGPSTLNHRTLERSGPLPLAFLRGCGLPDALIDYLPSLLVEPVQFYCFISHASKDHAFAERLYADLQSNGVRCYFAPEDLPIGAKIRVSIDESIRVCDKLLLILSRHSAASQWVEQEVETALARERQQKTTILFPVRIDNAVMSLETGWPAMIRNTRNIGDFRRWKTHDVYQKAFGRLLRDLKATGTQP
jgi:uncharacterized protein YjbI with pentapeptide repeats